MTISKKMTALLCSTIFVAGPITFINPSSSHAAENVVVSKESNAPSPFTIENKRSTANTEVLV